MSSLWKLGALLRRNGDFRRLFAATVVSLLGDWFCIVAISGFIVEKTGRPGLATLVYSASVFPILFLAPLAGVVADRWDRRRLMVAADLARVVPALGMLAALHLGSPALAIVCILVISALSAFFEPAAAAAAPNVVDAEDLPVAQAAMGSLWGTMLFVGAAAGGLVTAAMGRDTSILIDAASFLASAALIAGVRRPLRVAAAAPEGTIFGHIKEVWRFVAARPVVRALIVTKTGVSLGNGLVALLPVYALVRFKAGDAGVGTLLAARGLGALIGPFVTQPLVKNDGRRLLVVCGASILLYGLAYLFLPLTGNIVLACVFITLAHVGGGAQWTLSTYGLQVATPDEVRGRVLSLDYGIATFIIGVSALVAGGAAEVIGLEPASWALAGVSLLYGVSWLTWSRKLWRGKEDPLR